MAVYFDYIPSAVQWSTSALDPTNEVVTFLSYKMTDWCNKIGPNYAFMRNDHRHWQNVSNTSDTWLDVGLLGPDYRSGAVPTSWTGLSFRRRYSDRWYFGIGNKPRLIDYGVGYHDASNFVRNSSGNMDYFDGGYSELGYADNYWQSNDFTPGRPSYVLYSDTPGQRYFFWFLNGYTSECLRAGIVETKPIPGRLDRGDGGWAVSLGSIMYPLYGGWDDSNPQDYRYEMVSENPRTLAFTQYGPNYSYNTSYAIPMTNQSVLRDYHGDPQSYCDFIYTTQTGVFDTFHTYRIAGKKYMAWATNQLIPIE